MNTQPQIIRVPPSIPPRTRNASGCFGPDDPRPIAFWREVLCELRKMRWPRARDVAARTLAAIALLAFLALLASACGAVAQAMVGV